MKSFEDKYGGSLKRTRREAEGEEAQPIKPYHKTIMLICIICLSGLCLMTVIWRVGEHNFQTLKTKYQQLERSQGIAIAERKNSQDELVRTQQELARTNHTFRYLALKYNTLKEEYVGLEGLINAYRIAYEKEHPHKVKVVDDMRNSLDWFDPGDIKPKNRGPVETGSKSAKAKR